MAFWFLTARSDDHADWSEQGQLLLDEVGGFWQEIFLHKQISTNRHCIHLEFTGTREDARESRTQVKSALFAIFHRETLSGKTGNDRLQLWRWTNDQSGRRLA